MIELADAGDFPASLRGGVLCVGNFDGVHLGHAKMLGAGRDMARRRGAPFVIMTFEPHPATVLRPTIPRLPLSTLAQRRELLAAFDPDVLLVIPPSREFLATPAEDFLQDTVRGRIGAGAIVEGPTFSFGRGASGDVAMLHERGKALGFATTIVDTVETGLCDRTLVKVSSSLVRWLVEHGRVLDAARCLGRPFAIRGRVLVGAQRGRKLGFPTANVQVSQIVPAAGVYAGVARTSSGGKGRVHPAAISVGTNPTFAGTSVTVEAHLLDFAGDLYDQTIDVEVVRWLRDMEKFATVEGLVRQMAGDVAQVRSFGVSV